METKKVNIPKRGAGRALATMLEDLSNQRPPKDLVHKLSRGSRKKEKIAASPRRPLADSETQQVICARHGAIPESGSDSNQVIIDRK